MILFLKAFSPRPRVVRMIFHDQDTKQLDIKPPIPSSDSTNPTKIFHRKLEYPLWETSSEHRCCVSTSEKYILWRPLCASASVPYKDAPNYPPNEYLLTGVLSPILDGDYVPRGDSGEKKQKFLRSLEWNIWCFLLFVFIASRLSSIYTFLLYIIR